jgi:hypothetical protein
VAVVVGDRVGGSGVGRRQRDVEDGEPGGRQIASDPLQRGDDFLSGQEMTEGVVEAGDEIGRPEVGQRPHVGDLHARAAAGADPGTGRHRGRRVTGDDYVSTL